MGINFIFTCGAAICAYVWCDDKLKMKQAIKMYSGDGKINFIVRRVNYQHIHRSPRNQKRRPRQMMMYAKWSRARLCRERAGSVKAIGPVIRGYAPGDGQQGRIAPAKRIRKGKKRPVLTTVLSRKVMLSGNNSRIAPSAGGARIKSP